MSAPLGQGHRDTNPQVQSLSGVKNLNIQMDQKAESTYDLEYDWLGCAQMPVLQGEKWAVYVGDKKVTMALRKNFIITFMKTT